MACASVAAFGGHRFVGAQTFSRGLEKPKERRKSIDHKGQWWLRVGRSGLKWTLIPPAHGQHRLSSNLLRRRISSRHRRKKSHHYPLPLASKECRRIYSPA